MQKLSFKAVASFSYRGLLPRLSQGCLTLIIKSNKNKLLQRIKASCQKLETRSRNTKQLQATQTNSKDQLLLGNSQKRSLFRSVALKRPVGDPVSGETRSVDLPTEGYADGSYSLREATSPLLSPTRGQEASDCGQGSPHATNWLIACGLEAILYPSHRRRETEGGLLSSEVRGRYPLPLRWLEGSVLYPLLK